MEQSVFGLMGMRIIISIVGIVGNTVLIISILHMTRLKTFEVFLLGLALSNLEEIVIVDIYDVIMFRSAHSLGFWSCSALKFMTISGEVASILFTVLISIFRYQKLHNAAIRVITPIFMDSMKIAIGFSVGRTSERLRGSTSEAPSFLRHGSGWWSCFAAWLSDYLVWRRFSSAQLSSTRKTPQSSSRANASFTSVGSCMLAD
ncbi:hypothetical protein MHYP_G00057420 [Metynnis hypsauchen]